MYPLRSRLCLRCYSQPKNRSSGPSSGEDPTVPGSSPPQKIHVGCDLSCSSPNVALKFILGITGILKSPSCLLLPPHSHPKPIYTSCSFSLLLAVLGFSQALSGFGHGQGQHPLPFSTGLGALTFSPFLCPSLQLHFRAGERMC